MPRAPGVVYRHGMRELALGIVLIALLGLAVESDAAGSRKKGPPTGLSAWTYDFDEVRVQQIIAQHAQPDPRRRFAYLFPYAGSVNQEGGHKANVTYTREGPAQFAKALPKGILLLPIVDGRQDEKEFNDWTDAEYDAVAADVAKAIIDDPNAAGVQIDIEPFHDSHLPFYESLGARLKKKGKIMTGFLSPGRSEAALTRMYRACSIVVLSGYDLELPDPVSYGKALHAAVDRCLRIAAKVGGRTMIGIPAGGSWAEHEYRGIVENGACKKELTGFKQTQWLGAALEAVKPFESDPSVAGLALWVLTGRTSAPEDECLKGDHPHYISDACWSLLRAPVSLDSTSRSQEERAR